MNRKYKFKAFLKRKNKIVDVRTIHFHNSCIVYEDKSNEYSNVNMLYVENFKDIELLPLVDLKDKNGVEIYEGCILKAAGYPAIEVIYDKESCSFKMKVQYIGWEDLLILSSNKTPHLEVIGNIYENPELLGGTYDR